MHRRETCDGTPPPPPGSTFDNATDVTIPDTGAAVASPITVSGRARQRPGGTSGRRSTSSTPTAVTWSIDLVAPDGTAYRLKNSSPAPTRADNVITTYTVNASTEAANGTWRLQVRDVYRTDTGYINSWSITL